jgi:hypothetical protein
MRTLPVTPLGMFTAYKAITTGDEALTASPDASMDASVRSIRRYLVAGRYVLVSLGSAQAVTIGENVLSALQVCNRREPGLLRHSRRRKSSLAQSADVVRRLAPPGVRQPINSWAPLGVEG